MTEARLAFDPKRNLKMQAAVQEWKLVIGLQVLVVRFARTVPAYIGQLLFGKSSNLDAP